MTKAALIFTVLASLTANIKAIDYALLNGSGHVMTSIGARMTIKQVDSNSIRVKWNSKFKAHDGGNHFTAHATSFYLTSKTIFSGGTSANIVVGAVVHITYHFEGDHTVADTVQFVRVKS
jgi:hypothetical protein